MKRTLGNYLTQPNKDFPVDTETFDTIQQNQSLLAVLGNIAGDQAILLGCEPEQNGTRRGPGYIFLRTQEFPEGEILYWEGGAVSSGLYLKRETVAVSSQGYEYPQAYTVRSLAPGVGAENYTWAEMRAVSTLPELERAHAALCDEVALLTPPPLGIVQLWAGSKVPAGYALCEGQQLKTDEYPALYRVLGSTFNTAYNASGERYTTANGHFRLPDLRGRFVVGYHPIDTDYQSYGTAGGEKKHRLTVDEMPAHAHKYTIYTRGSKDRQRFSSKHNNDNDTDETRTSETVGGSAAHENRPPYYVLAYIMRLE